MLAAICNNKHLNLKECDLSDASLALTVLAVAAGLIAVLGNRGLIFTGMNSATIQAITYGAFGSISLAITLLMIHFCKKGEDFTDVAFSCAVLSFAVGLIAFMGTQKILFTSLSESTIRALSYGACGGIVLSLLLYGIHQIKKDQRALKEAKSDPHKNHYLFVKELVCADRKKTSAAKTGQVES